MTGFEAAVADLAEPLGTIIGVVVVTVAAWWVGRRRHPGRSPDGAQYDEHTVLIDLGNRILGAVQTNGTMVERVLNTLALEEAFRKGREAGERDQGRWRPP